MKAKINELKDTIRRKSDEVVLDLNSLEEVVVSSQIYVDSVINMERISEIQRFRLPADEYRDRLQEADRRRRVAHESLMATLNMANRMAQLYGLDPLFRFEDRYEAAEIAGEIVLSYFRSSYEGKLKKQPKTGE